MVCGIYQKLRDLFGIGIKKGLRVNFKKIVIVEVRECHPVGQLMSTPTSQWGSLSPSS